jgi:hypothetical protein
MKQAQQHGASPSVTPLSPGFDKAVLHQLLQTTDWTTEYRQQVHRHGMEGAATRGTSSAFSDRHQQQPTHKPQVYMTPAAWVSKASEANKQARLSSNTTV